MNALVLLALCTSLITAPMDASAGLENAKTFARIGDWENGIKYLEAYIIQNPTDAEARLLLAECYYNWPDKQTVGEEVVDKNRARGYAQIGILAKLGDDGLKMLLRGLRSESGAVFAMCCDVLKEDNERRAIGDLVEIARENAARRERAIATLVEMEKDREELDKRVPELLLSLLERPDTELPLRVSYAQGLASLHPPGQLSAMTKALEQVLKSLPKIQRRDDENYLIEEALYLVDAILRASPGKKEESVSKVLNQMARRTLGKFFDRAEERHWQLGIETLSFLSVSALSIAEKDPGLFGEGPNRFLHDVASGYPNMLLDPKISKRLHDLCDSPQTYVRRIAERIIGRIGDESALPILHPKLQAAWFPSGATPREVRVLPGGDRAYHVNMFAWANPDTETIWETVRTIDSPRTSEFLLEKLESDDMAWVYTATKLLWNMGEARALEPLKKRYSEISGPDAGDRERAVVNAIAAAYRALSGQPLDEREERAPRARPIGVPYTEPQGEAATGRSGMMRRVGTRLMDETRREYVGLGIKLQLSKGPSAPISASNPLVVGKVLPDSPASRSDIREGDAIVKVDGETTEGLSMTDVLNKIKGPPGTRVTLTLRRILTESGLQMVTSDFDVEVERAKIPLVRP
jgi:tetratricopeptide (TPR) repeat protein